MVRAFLLILSLLASAFRLYMCLRHLLVYLSLFSAHPGTKLLVSHAAPLSLCCIIAATSFAASTKPQHDALSAQEFSLPQDLVMPKWIQAPLSPQQRSAYRASIGGKWKWSEALPELQYYYETYGFGVTSMNTSLQWTDGAIQAYEYLKQRESGRYSLSVFVSCHACSKHPQ